jgi:flagellar motor switch protein FliM
MTVQIVSADVPRAQRAEVYDFARPMRLGRERALELRQGSESFARSWQTELSAHLRASCRVSVADITMLSYDDYLDRIPASSVMVLCGIDGVESSAIMQFPLATSLGWIARMVGGSVPRAIPARPLSPIEQALITRTVERALDLMHYSMGSSLPRSLAAQSIVFSAQSAKAASPFDAMVLTVLELSIDAVTTEITFAVPAYAMETGPIGGSVFDGDPAKLILGQLHSVPLRVALQLQPTTVRPGVVLGLAEGDLIRLAHPRTKPLTLAVDGQVMARAAVGASGSQLACVVVDTQEAS